MHKLGVLRAPPTYSWAALHDSWQYNLSEVFKSFSFCPHSSCQKIYLLQTTTTTHKMQETTFSRNCAVPGMTQDVWQSTFGGCICFLQINQWYRLWVQCNSTSRIFIRTWWGLTKVPSHIPTEALQVELSGNIIASLPAGVFRHFSQCKVLELRFNQISSIEENAFRGLDSLERLDLSNNRISMLRAEMFTGLNNLGSLHLARNVISSIEQQTFEGLESLQNLQLRHNRISILPARIFISLRNLTELMLFQNNISSIEEQVFQGLESLKTLFFSSNNISILHVRMFKELKTLEWLYLQSDHINRHRSLLRVDLSSVSELGRQQNHSSWVRIVGRTEESWRPFSVW